MTEAKPQRSERRLFPVRLDLHCLGKEFKEPFPEMSRPKCTGFFSINGQREYQDNAENLGYLYMPKKLPLDLNAGIHTVIRKTGDPLYFSLHMLCKYIYNHQGELLQPYSGGKPGARRLDADFVTLRGVLRYIMCMLYENNKEVRLHAVRMNNNIYLARVETEKEKLEREGMSALNVNMCSWGFKFEQYLISSKPTEKPKTDVPVNECTEFNGMFKCKFAGSTLLYAAEMDCVETSEEINLNDANVLHSLKFVELKTSFKHMNPRQKNNFEIYKTSMWWSQSFLVGISTIYAGLRDSQGFVQEIKQYDVRDLARKKSWSPNAMGVFLKEFLHQLKCLLEDIDDPYTVVQIDYNARMKELSYIKIKNDDRANQILPDWYRLLLNDRPTKKIKH
ncbi:decapping and exoribonuclease protein Rai1 [Drosophila tropicalis]|uniref:decapping and exoribonuclease protein Rai1 n=1 Tax=Drosophila tropicalis TaxID=46794 RepID=UPI0035ABB5EA